MSPVGFLPALQKNRLKAPCGCNLWKRTVLPMKPLPTKGVQKFIKVNFMNINARPTHLLPVHVGCTKTLCQWEGEKSSF